jgi:hypothetical protein
MENEAKEDRRGGKVWVILALSLVGLAVAAGPALALGRHLLNIPQGHPDPHGRRLAYLQYVAHAAVPTPGSALSVKVSPFAWDHGGCVVGTRGWTRAEVDIDFYAAAGSQIDLAMKTLRWKRVPAPGGDAVREYEPDNDQYQGYAWLYNRAAVWELDVSAAPAGGQC